MSKSILKKLIALTAIVSIVGAMSIGASASSFNVYQTGSGSGDHYTDSFNRTNAKKSYYAYCSATTNSGTSVTVVVPGAQSWDLAMNQGHTFTRSSSGGNITCTVTLNPVTGGAESAQGTFSN